MKKIFTLIAMALMAVSANAQEWRPTKEAPAAGVSIIKGDLLKVNTVFETTCGETLDEGGKLDPQTFAGKTFDTYMQIRVDAAPTAATPTGTDKGGSTPLVITAKKNVDLTIYYRRQNVDGVATENDGKDMKLIDQAAATTLIAAASFETFEINSDYSNAKKVFKLEEGKTYTLWARGTTGRLYGIDFQEGSGSEPTPQPGEDGVIPEGYNSFYSWTGDAETGGKAVASDEVSVGYANADYVTIRVNGKKADMDTNYILVTLDEALQAGDIINITAYRNKGTGAESSLYFLFENGTIVDDEYVFNDIQDAGKLPNAHNWVVAEAAGSKSFKLSRGKASTNTFITALKIARQGGTGIQNVKAQIIDVNAPVYNLSGQMVDKSYKGVVIQNGRKMIQK